MAYDRYDTRGRSRDDQSRWSNDRDRYRDPAGRDDDRGFFERASDEVASWFGDDDAERRRERDRRTDERGSGDRSWDRGDDRGRSLGRERGGSGDRGRDETDHGPWSSRGYRSYGGSGGVPRSRWRDGGLGHAPGFEGGTHPMFGGYTEAESVDRDYDFRPITGDYGRSGSPQERSRSSNMDPHYHSWRRRQMDEFDRDYDDYRRENQARFEDDFTNWRSRRQQKRGLLVQIREHMEVVGNDDEHVGTVDRIAGDRVILAKSDPESSGVHHSLSCSDIDRVEGDRIILDCSAEQARQRWRDESRSRALFEREDQGEMGPRMLDRSFEGTYR